MKIKMYRPAFFSGFEEEYAEFNTKEELENVSFIKNWLSDGFHIEYEIDDCCGQHVTLLACNKTHFYVLVDSSPDPTGEFSDLVKKNYKEWKIENYPENNKED